MVRPTVLLLLALVAAGARAEVRVERFYGYVYDLDSGRYLYTETHERRLVDGRWRSGATAFYLPDGTEFGRKTLTFADDPYVPLYELVLSREGYREGITASGAAVEMMRQWPRGKVEKGTLKKEGLVVADAGMAELLLDKLEALQAGETVAFRVVAPSRLDSYRFRARGAGPAAFEGKPAVSVRVDMDSMLKLFAGPLLFTIDPATRRILEFRGPTNVRDPVTGKDYHVRISFYSTPPPDAPRQLPSIGSESIDPKP